MDGNIKALYDVILKRKTEGEEGSYTKYLFEKGTDKILKKVGEECTEVIISCKEDNKEEQINEICDLTFHLLVLMAQMDISVEEVSAELERRRNKINNLKSERKPIINV
ncbi:phosphoribosyl-ATP diphosphatase [Clostridium saccharoperbutylacetonicum]|jgi:phosphoribosyl-ATP pyrophosphohydrolase|uniref:Phosphoribosyl-ATP pyrophosphatase n=1 Tax=Clostridium saccharoperbutylacetonicum N1-4(HMT) TaxID=931276 RepID=M1MKH9_9CLOT|nr:phosphoribosyl-ATP diphosphatase [Clostridium saccharoperbutylacetonicum]AGF55311.1 phosphoribosyl-ATP pyrophosphatase HisE [Clostridium saccharoperbutylacetonicum N1-4(HMT)]AQR94197.1 phosphoribosyl-ATP pyrophosphatase [Clostridium saccharoperbutylacetonicum]NRT63976.1 phosphoribosyl-ATP pyrophosphohydrolase [Clostridium saccharoperbutylacetonicum]NSB27343.1 phosphoribosyl-ATP pyrophosphohydrolase [Clostridium saccharoperbutylacetonicum]NSB29897.1 phosphoribosyl-ATP pyrophosphohydrolase [C